MNEIQIFNNPEFGQVRTLMIDDEAWFVGIEVARILGYANASKAVVAHVDGDDKKFQMLSADSQNGNPVKTAIINESGLYSLIFSSKLDSAKRFKKWVTSEVLPSIRKTGSYSTPQLPQSPMELLELHYKAIREVDGKVESLSGDLQSVRNELQAFKEDMPVLGIEESRITNAVRARGVKCMGGKDSNAYRNKTLRGKLYSDLYHQLKREFGVTSYKAIRRNQCDKAIEIVEGYEPPMVLDQAIRDENAQMTIGMEEG